eukprot:GEMP01010635.1.p1 GENE.GEMP01010635.1~~GEMP01010635.1.p1  ORF type:complete len:789 (-),score=217.29 GEMP01010635.1:912-3278(-)
MAPLALPDASEVSGWWPGVSMFLTQLEESVEILDEACQQQQERIDDQDARMERIDSSFEQMAATMEKYEEHRAEDIVIRVDMQKNAEGASDTRVRLGKKCDGLAATLEAVRRSFDDFQKRVESEMASQREQIQSYAPIITSSEEKLKELESTLLSHIRTLESRLVETQHMAEAAAANAAANAAAQPGKATIPTLSLTPPHKNEGEADAVYVHATEEMEPTQAQVSAASDVGSEDLLNVLLAPLFRRVRALEVAFTTQHQVSGAEMAAEEGKESAAEGIHCVESSSLGIKEVASPPSRKLGPHSHLQVTGPAPPPVSITATAEEEAAQMSGPMSRQETPEMTKVATKEVMREDAQHDAKEDAEALETSADRLVGHENVLTGVPTKHSPVIHSPQPKEDAPSAPEEERPVSVGPEAACEQRTTVPSPLVTERPDRSSSPQAAQEHKQDDSTLLNKLAREVNLLMQYVEPPLKMRKRTGRSNASGNTMGRTIGSAGEPPTVAHMLAKLHEDVRLLIDDKMKYTRRLHEELEHFRALFEFIERVLPKDLSDAMRFFKRGRKSSSLVEEVNANKGTVQQQSIDELWDMFRSHEDEARKVYVAVSRVSNYQKSIMSRLEDLEGKNPNTRVADFDREIRERSRKEVRDSHIERTDELKHAVEALKSQTGKVQLDMRRLDADLREIRCRQRLRSPRSRSSSPSSARRPSTVAFQARRMKHEALTHCASCFSTVVQGGQSGSTPEEMAALHSSWQGERNGKLRKKPDSPLPPVGPEFFPRRDLKPLTSKRHSKPPMK